MFALIRHPLAPRLVLCLAFLTMAACSSDDDPMEPEPSNQELAGSWSRVNSSFTELDGMVVLVDNAETQG